MSAEDIAKKKSYRRSDTLDWTVMDLFNDHVEKHPDNIAIIFQKSHLTYKQLDEKANELAADLIEKGICPDTLVPLCLERSPEMIIGILGILKAGGAYVPLDPSFPDDRLGYMLEDIEAAHIVTSSSLEKRFGQHSPALILLDGKAEGTSRVPHLTESHGLAYAIYTSGSTGKPKAVLVEHHSLMNYITHQTVAFEINQDDIILQTTNYAFDPSVEQIFLALCNGAKLVLIDKNILADPRSLERMLHQEKITHLHATPSLLQLINPGRYSLKRVVAGGESCPPALAASWSGYVPFFNKYGPTEATISSTQFTYNATYAGEKFVPIGMPILNTVIYILDEDGNQLGTGEPGELCIGGEGVARGYLNRTDLTREKFVADPFSGIPYSRMYRTGDIARWLPDGNLEFLQRIDDQVKINGHRIEPGEIEQVLTGFSSIQQAVVVAHQEDERDTRLAAYIVSGKEEDPETVRKYLAVMLPPYLIPFYITQLAALPLTANGKTDKKALPVPVIRRPQTGSLYVAPGTDTEKKIGQIWTSVLHLDRIGIHDNFFEIGGSSLLAIKAISILNKQEARQVLVTIIYQHLTIHGIASALDSTHISKHSMTTAPVVNEHSSADVAVIGMSGRFPGADSIQELWELLRLGKESISFFKDEDIDPSVPDSLKKDPFYIKARGVLNKAEEFDAAFFGINPKLAELMDPQHRVFLEIAWEALESAGYVPNDYRGSIGVFAGCRNNMYYYTNVLHHPELVERVGSFQVMTANEKDYLATRTAFSLDLRGPAVNVQSACSTSLLAIAQAVQSIRTGQCDMALAGAAAIALPINSGYLYQEGAMLSNDGHCRPFDADARGTVFCDGAGVVLLKSRQQAEKDGDIIYAYIKGIGVNNDGGFKGSFTAPSVSGQAGAISMALRDAAVDPSTISYVEAHGTATPLGDPIEIEALQLAYGKREAKQSCAIGSIKSNLGHLTAASGAAGFIKTVLSLHHKKLIPTLFYQKPNPDIDFANSNFYVNTECKQWESDGIRRAGISAFGVGGTNVHLILEENDKPEKEQAPSKLPQLVCWSAKNETSRSSYGARMNNYLDEHPQTSLADIAYTLHVHRQHFHARRFIVSADASSLRSALTGGPASVKLLATKPSGIIFMFPGQGSQYVNMGRELYEQEEVFRKAADECFLLIKNQSQEDLREIIYPIRNAEKTGELLRNTRYAQPAIFIIEYATAKLWMSWGINPSSFIGHSIGEFVAAHLAGVFSLADALKLIASRGRIMSELPAGSMLSVKLSADKISSLLPKQLSVAAINSPGLCVVAGESGLIANFARQLSESDIPNSLLHTSHAFHSSMMEPAVAPFREILDSVQFHAPAIPIISTVTGSPLTNEEAMSIDYWSRHLRKTVRFSDAIGHALENPNRILLEVGPMNVATTLARQQSGSKMTAINSLEPPSKGIPEYVSMLHALGQLWLNGAEPDWKTFYAGQQRIRLNDLPSYAFDKKYCWVSPKLTDQRPIASIAAEPEAHDEQEKAPGQQPMSTEALPEKIRRILTEASGLDIHHVDSMATFIEMGLDSLSLTQIALTLKKEFNLPITFRQLNETYTNIGTLSAYIQQHEPRQSPEAAQKEAATVASPAGEWTTVPSVESQVEIFTACLFGGEAASCSYNQSVHLKLHGQYDHAAMVAALQDLTDRHESLRSSFSADGRSLNILSSLSFAPECVDLSGRSPDDQEHAIEDFYRQYASTPFDLQTRPLFKAAIFTLSGQEHYLTLMAHHIICDGWSFSILMEDLGLLYNAHAEHKLPVLKEPGSFSRFSLAQQEFYGSLQYEANGRYWSNLYKNNVPVLSVPTDMYRPPVRTYQSQRSDFTMDEQLLEQIRKMGAENGCSFVTTLLAAFQFYIHQLSGQDQIVIGLPVAGQPATGYYRLVGHCVNLLPVRSDIDASAKFVDFLQRQRTNVLDAFDHQQYTYGSILKQLPIHRDPSRIPLVPIVFNFDTGMDNKVVFNGLEHTRISKGRTFENFEIFLNLNDAGNGVSLEWSFNTNLFKPASIRQMMDDFAFLLRCIAADNTISLDQLGAQFRDKTMLDLSEWNATRAVYPNKTVHQLFSEQAVRSPTNKAVQHGGTIIQYEELDKSSNRFAALLRSHGIYPGDMVGVALDRNSHLMTTLLGILKAGAAYVPLDPGYPKDRVEFMLQDSGSKILLTSKKYSGLFKSGATEILLEEAIADLLNYADEAPDICMDTSGLAYILYTSGSTGKPKGVQIEHRSLVNFLCSMQKDLGIEERDTLLAVTTISFDISGLELYLPLITGASVIIAEADTVRDGRLLLELINDKKPDIMQATPSAWQMLFEAGFDQSDTVRTICCGGEALSNDLANKLLGRCQSLFNLYGPTETTIWSTLKKIERKNEIITIGRPIANTQVYILNEQLEPVSKNTTGEIYISGDGVARGYHNRPELTAEKFVNDPFSTDRTQKMYRTGDVGKFLSTGEILCQGRIDHQIKIRGHRIELDEIQHALAANPAVKQVVVVAREFSKNDQRLVAYIVPGMDNHSVDESKLSRELKDGVAKKLPAYMVPNHYVFLNNIPVTPNGKTDRNALPAPGAPQKESVKTAPLSREEMIVSKIWKEVLGLTEIGVDEDFFELGGHSMIAVQMMTRLEKETGVHLPLATLFEQSTIKKLASFLSTEDKTVAWNCLVTIKGTGSKTPIYMIHGIGGSAPFVNTKIKDFDPDQPIYGIQARGLNGNGEMVESVEEMASLYIKDIIKQNPNGPYALVGYSFGGFVAFEMAQQLKAMGREVKMVGILDTYSGIAYRSGSRLERAAKRLYHSCRRTVFSLNVFLENPKEKIAFEYDEIRKKARSAYYLGLQLMGRKRRNWFHYKNQIAKNNYIALRKYRLKPYEGTVCLFRSQNKTYYLPDFTYLGWKEFSDVQVFEIPGEHNTIFSPANEMGVVKVLQSCLDGLDINKEKQR